MGGRGSPSSPQRAIAAPRMSLRRISASAFFTQYLFFRQWNALRAYIREAGHPDHRRRADLCAARQRRRVGGGRVLPARRSSAARRRSRASRLITSPPTVSSGATRSMTGTVCETTATAGGSGVSAPPRASSTIPSASTISAVWRAIGPCPTARTTARSGHWRKGPRRELYRRDQDGAPGLDIIAEDLGFLTPEVIALREYSGFPA